MQNLRAVVCILMAIFPLVAFADTKSWEVSLGGGYSQFRESAADLQLDSRIQIDRRGNAWFVGLRREIMPRTAIEAGYIDFGKAGLALPFIDGVRRINGHFLGLRYCDSLSSLPRLSICGGAAIARTAREIEDRLGLDHDHVREPLLSVGARVQLSESLSFGVDWRGVTKSRVSAGFASIQLAF